MPVGQLRQNPTAMLHRVQRGETCLITNHGVPVAKLSPVDDYKWLDVDTVRDLLTTPETTNWGADIRQARQAESPSDPWPQT